MEALNIKRMYRRFLNNADYLGIITEEALSQLIRDKEVRFSQAEEAAEESVVEYLTDNYQIEKCLAVGKNLLPHNGQVTYPAGAHFLLDGKVVKAIRPINGYKAPFISPYWEPYFDEIECEQAIPFYSQTLDWKPQDIVRTSMNDFYICLAYNGPSYNDIRVPGVTGWVELPVGNWEANESNSLWTVKRFDGKCYALISEEDIDLTVNPAESDNWGLIGEYTPEYEYELSSHEYVTFKGRVFYPCMNVNADKVQFSFNVTEDDPRNPNIKKHMLRLAIYELHKLISPNNISSARITDYETSITWLRDASKLKINPHIPRRLDETHRPDPEYAIATFARDYDPYKNPWQI